VSPSSETHRGPGRPRSDAATEAIIGSALSLLEEVGYEGLTIDAVAARAGASKATIYRRWRTKDEVVLSAIETLAAPVPAPDTASLEGDLKGLADGLVAAFGQDGVARLIGTVVDQMARKPEFATAIREGFLRNRRGAARTVLERARERGEIPPDRDLGFVIDLLAAPFYYRLLLTGGPVDEGLGKEVVGAVLAWLAAEGFTQDPDRRRHGRRAPATAPSGEPSHPQRAPPRGSAGS
jgi:AcrR family transcriptional regulator